MADPDYIDPSQVQPGPIRHASLSEEVLTQAKAVIDVLGPYLGTTLEQFEINLMRDADPEAEVAVWCSIAAAWIEYHERYLDDEIQPDEFEKKLVAALLLISMGVEDVHRLDVTPEVGKKLLECYGRGQDDTL